jgi:hypothetical protein
MEALQILKFSRRQERLCFTRDLIAKEDDYKISGPVTRRAAEELRDTGKFDELADLLQNVNDDNVE